MHEIAISLGDPAGIGPEVTNAALHQWYNDPEARQAEPLRWRVIGSPNVLADLGLPPQVALDSEGVDPFDGPRGQPSIAGGRAALQALDRALALSRAGVIKGLVSAPISKEALALAGSPYRGHTELLRDGFGVSTVAMAFDSPQLRVVLATVHEPLVQAVQSLTPGGVVEVAALFARALSADWGIASPRLALAGLNPHAGENGLLGEEEGRILQPAVTLAESQHIPLTGPYPADSVFRRAYEGEFDGVVALYHDQGLIPVKVMGGAVNVTLGLPVVRTSPDHGTAFDRVGTSTIRHDGMFDALASAWHLVQQRAVQEGATDA